MVDEHPDARRARRLAEARSRRGTPEWEARGAELERQRAAEAKRALDQRKTSAAMAERRSPENSSDIFGHPWPEWFRMRDAALAHLDACAVERRTTSYRELWHAIAQALDTDLGSHWRQLPNLLGYVTETGYAETGLMPTALVVSPARNDEPEAGFFRLAAQLGELPEADSPPHGQDWTMTPAQRAFWHAQVTALYERRR